MRACNRIGERPEFVSNAINENNLFFFFSRIVEAVKENWKGKHLKPLFIF